MLAIRIELLSGRYVATAYNDRDQAEWPPHPARLFSALVAAWAEHEPPCAAEERALRWMEGLGAPQISAAPEDEVARRSALTCFVPVNDCAVVTLSDRDLIALSEVEPTPITSKRAATREKIAARVRAAIAVDPRENRAALDSATAMLPERRGRQARTFPSLRPARPLVDVFWPDAHASPEVSEALGCLLSRVVRLGHSSSFVSARVIENPQPASHRPDPDGDLILRVPGPGQLDRLTDAWERHQATEPRVLPCAFARYSTASLVARVPITGSVFDPAGITVLARTSGPRLPSLGAVGVARMFRRALLAAIRDPVPEAISGHRADGGPSERAHLAIVPLPFVGSAHADGSILGVALIAPRDFTDADREALHAGLGALGAETPEIPLRLGASGVLGLRRVVWGEHRLANLRSGTWARPAPTWATATPIALDRVPGDLHDAAPAARAAAFAAAEQLVATAIERIGLPPPRAIEVSRSCLVAGTEKPRGFPRFPPDDRRPQRVLVHARLHFHEPVRGPVLLGAGRYLGLGLCRPLDAAVPPDEEDLA